MLLVAFLQSQNLEPLFSVRFRTDRQEPETYPV
jgi:hypothetical protein